ncbi:RtcB family protein [Deferribacter autotrophicus]|uniref:tRNA-splicing ligase RtcB n=1 Tax=Deferribacter autotrophicus TaxID=500465 RepID=A0A5A8F341_9BACT|nr:RtcB family protein [Deferribacter autotrophicus]KAA0258213.1 RtcB family protein [Deferribacter autotrophicus]
MKLVRKEKFIYEIPIDKELGMRVPGLVFASEDMIESIETEGVLQQVANAATLPGIQKASIAMPDIHYGYGLPIGGVVATDVDEGVITPGGVGFDINCGVRLITFDISIDDLNVDLESLAKKLYRNIPCGVGEGGKIKVKKQELKQVLKKGARWAVENGFGNERDLEATESYGFLASADPEAVSNKAYERGYDQLGTLGSGNHFVEIGCVETILNKDVAEKWGLFEKQLTLLIHTGSRGLGHQVCTDFLGIFEKSLLKYGISVPDKQLACAPVKSPEGNKYLAALSCAANFAWANRQILMHLSIETIMEVLNISRKLLNPRLVYDVAHNIVKFERYEIDGKERLLAVHRKGATRALPPNHEELPDMYKDTGQPVIIPGDMGRYSYLLVGGKKAEELSFNSACHGAGRKLSRHKAIKMAQDRNIAEELKLKGIFVISRGKRTLKEEMPEAYKDVSDVVDVVDYLDIAKKVLKLRPLCVIKG